MFRQHPLTTPFTSPLGAVTGALALAVALALAGISLAGCASAAPLGDINAHVAEHPLPPDVREPRVAPPPPGPPPPADQPLAIPRAEAPPPPESPPPAVDDPLDVRFPDLRAPRIDPLAVQPITERIRREEGVGVTPGEAVDLLTVRLGERRFVTPPVGPDDLRAILEPPAIRGESPAAAIEIDHPRLGTPFQYHFIDRYGRHAIATVTRRRDATGEWLEWSVQYSR